MRKLFITFLLIIMSLCVAIASVGCNFAPSNKGDDEPLGPGPEVPPATRVEVTADEFNLAIDLDSILDYKIALSGTEFTHDDFGNINGTSEVEGEIAVNGTKAKLVSNSLEVYVEFLGDGNCHYYFTSGDGFIRMTTSEEEGRTFFNPFYDGLDFADFTFDSENGVYVYNNADKCLLLKKLCQKRNAVTEK